MKKYMLASVQVFLCLYVQAQQNTIQPLTIGDTVPDITLLNVYNYPTKSARLSDFKGKYLILDLWSNSCRSCIEAFPKLQALQQQFANKLQVILANPHNQPSELSNQSLAIIKNVEQNTGINITMPVALKDTLLNELFPHLSVPHVIITDTARRVVAITSSAYITAGNISQLISGTPYWFPYKNELDFDRKKPLLVAGNGGSSGQYQYRSLFTGYLDGAEAATGWDRAGDGNVSRYYIINYPLIKIYRFAWPEELNRFFNRIVIEVADPSRFLLRADTSVDISRYYSYELSAPPDKPAVFREYLKEDLQRVFKATVVMEQRTLPCLVLKADGNLKRLWAITNEPKLLDITPLTKNKLISNQPLGSLLDVLNELLPLPVLDSSHITRAITLKLPYNIREFSVQEWNQFLKPYGLKLEKDRQLLEVAVIKDTNPLKQGL